MNFNDIKARVARAERVAVLTGAGISAPSGIPTFRDALTGLWAKFKPEELSNPQTYQRDPELVWEWFRWRYELCSEAKPNPAHDALVRLEQRVPEFALFTQNVDDLHCQAGSKRLVELHGNIARARCETCEHKERLPPAADFKPPPICERCGSRMRPDIVWFGEFLNPDDLDFAARAFSNCDLALVIGTSGVVEPAASLPRLASSHGAFVIEINPTETPISGRVDAALLMGAVEGLEAIMPEGW
jgi:NAD-dependent deacetylase